MVKYIAFKDGKLHHIQRHEARRYNQDKWGIFRTVNHFGPAKCLKKDNVTRLSYWFVDIDDGNKEDMLLALYSLPLRPTQIIETKAGYHAYWKTINKDATIENFRQIEKGIAAALEQRNIEADAAVCNINRFLRVPGFFHWKDKNNPFPIQTVWRDIDLRYSETEMLKAFPFTGKVSTNICKGGEHDILEILEKLNANFIGDDRCYCPIKQINEGRAHSSEVRGIPAMQIFVDTNTAYCFACAKSYTSDYLVRRFVNVEV
jgi:hypothetical protein